MKKISVLLFILATSNVSGMFIYVPFEELLTEAEYIVTGEIIDKKYKKKTSVMNRYERNPVTNRNEVIESQEYMEQFTDYELDIKEVIKGEINTGSIKLDVIGGCDQEGICMSISTGYSFEVGDHVFMLLKKRTDSDYYQSTHGGLTVYFVNEKGKIYKNKDELDFIKGSDFSKSHPPKPKTVDEVKSLLETGF